MGSTPSKLPELVCILGHKTNACLCSSATSLLQCHPSRYRQQPNQPPSPQEPSRSQDVHLYHYKHLSVPHLRSPTVFSLDQDNACSSQDDDRLVGGA